MKELSIEEKAKAYDEAIVKSVEFLNLCKKCGAKDTVDFLEDIFPELKESEDEKIRKAMIKGLSSCGSKYWGGFEIKAAIAWLEKQGGQKFAWSEEDEEILRTIISDGLRGAEFDMLQINWLKSLKDRFTWKPSDEQIECLYDAVKHYQTNGYPASKLNELYEQMSKIYKL